MAAWEPGGGGGDSARAQLPCSAGGPGGARKGRLSRAGVAAAQSRGGRSDVRELRPGRRARGAPGREGLKAGLGGASNLLAHPEQTPRQAAARDGVRAGAGAWPRRRGGEMPGSGDWLRSRGRGWDPAAAGGTVVPRPVLTCAEQGSSFKAFKKMPKITEGQIRSFNPGPGVPRFQTCLDFLLDPAGERPRPRRAVGGVAEAEPSLRGEGLPRTPARRPASASQRFRKPQVPWAPGGLASFEAAFL